MTDTLVIIDYGSGNLRSAAKSFERVIKDTKQNMKVKVSAHAEDLRKASHIVLPGQGAFGDCMNGLKAVDGMIEALEETVLKQGKPFLGICVGMQLLATKGLEHGKHNGLNWIPGEVVLMQPPDPALKIPHMGWNTLKTTQKHTLLCSITSSDHYYFVHSFMFKCKEREHVLAETNYGQNVAAIIGRDNIIGTQFHPEKSQNSGLKLLSEFVHWKP